MGDVRPIKPCPSVIVVNQPLKPETRLSSFFRKLLSPLALLYTAVVALASFSKDTPMRESIPPQRNTDDAANRSENVSPPVVRAIVESLPPPPPPTEEQRAKEKRDDRFKWLKFGLEVLAFGALVAYVCATIKTKNIAENSLAFSKESFAKDQRPWIWIETPQLFDLKVGQPPMLNIVFVNYGKSPAIAKTFVTLTIRANPDPREVKALQEYPISSYSVIIGPNQPKGIFSTAYNEQPLTQPTYNAITKGWVHVIIVGRVVYTDLIGNGYESWFCLDRLPNGAISFCPAPELNGMK